MSVPAPPALAVLGDLDRGLGQALLAATVSLGFSEPVAREGLSAELDAWVVPGALEAWRSELPPDLDPVRLPRTVLVVAAGTHPASTLRTVLRARVLGARVTLKPASGQADLGHAIAAADPDVVCQPFGSADRDTLDAAIAAADVVVALGSDRTMASLRNRVPATTPFVAHGHRVSAAWVSEEVTDDALLGLARDLCAWDQLGCLAPQVVWCEGDPDDVLSRLTEAVRTCEGTRPPLPVPLDVARLRAHATTLAELSGRRVSTVSAELLRLDVPTFRPSPGYRTLWILPADTRALDDLPLSALGCDRPPPVPLPADIRVCALGTMQRPPLSWRQDGRAQLLPMLLRRPSAR